MTLQQIVIPALCLFMLITFIIGMFPFILSGRISEYERQREEQERRERIVSGADKWKARVGE